MNRDHWSRLCIVDDGIHFGEVEQAAPERALRPDENRHFAVVAYGDPHERDLPIFVDLDVLADMEDHALSDTSVELGGVLLGGHYEDEHGRPFVVVTDSLRARHYESTKGSFKFTHDTWEAITRERDEFPPELAMVGWYHTHPDWGVFLSGMDMFICDNFFNKPLDVAYVIDPCRGDRGMFQWTGDPRHRVRRTGGFFVTASRFRAAELEHYVAELSGEMPVTTSRAGTGTYPAPVVHLHQPQTGPPPWQAPAVVGLLMLQFCLVALIAWRMVAPPAAAPEGSNSVVAAIEDLQESLAAERQAEIARERARAQAELMDRAFAELKGTEDGAISRLQERFDETQRLTAHVDAQEAQARELKRQIDDIASKLKLQEDRATSERERLNRQIAGLESKNEKLAANATKYQDEAKTLRDKYEPPPAEADGEPAASGISVWWYVAAATLAALVIVGGVWLIGGRGEQPADEPPVEEEKAEQPKVSRE